MPEIEQVLPAGPALPPPAPPPKPAKGIWAPIRENIETIVVALVAALFIRQYLLEPYKIPTGSMGPGLHGVHRDVACPACGAAYEVGCDDAPGGSGRLAGDVNNEAACPACGTRTPLGRHPRRRGDKILANKLVYLLRPPRRWEVVVFHYAAENKTYIKRLAGLPGDKLEIRRGDLHVNDRIAPRPPEVLEAMRVPVYDLAQDRPGAAGERWRFDPSRVARDRLGFTLSGAEWADLSYAPEITDWLCYNDWNKLRAAGYQATPVGDLRVALDCELPAGAGIGCEIQEDDQTYRWTLGGGAAGFSCAVQGRPTLQEALPALAPGRHRLVFANTDDVQTLEVDGREAGRWTIPSMEGDPAARVRILGHGGVRITALAIARDSAYSQEGEGRQGHPFRVPPGRYFFLGDNSHISRDSRKWGPTPEACTVPEADVLGRAFLAAVHLDLPWAVPLGELSCHWIR